MAMEATISSTASARPGLPRVIVAATIGNVLEWFDFLVYGFFAVTIAEVFFPAGYATIGLAAPIIITVARLLQGFSVGGEFGSAVTFLVEHAGERRGYSASWQWATIGMTSIIASLFGLVLTSQLSHQQLVDWGWRVPYVFGLLVGPAGLYIRARMAETPEFLKAEQPQRMPI